VGGGFLYLSRPMYEVLTNHRDHAEDRLAFVLAYEMGHIVRKHCRVGYQLLKLEDLAQREKPAEEELSKLKKTVKRVVEITGDRLRFLYEPNQEYEADLFAAHLCRNAGFDVEAGLDVLRRGVLTEEASGDLHWEPAHAMLSNDNALHEKNRPSASDRLRQLCFDRDGVITEPEYGLWEFDAKADQWIKPEELRVSEKDRVVLLVHGMDSTLTKCYLDLAREIARDRAFRGQRILGFEYPGDASLARVGTFLYHEISRTCDGRPTIDFVCHSAGGLVARYYAEVKDGPFERIILQGTPNHGSDWVRLRPLIEMKQFIKDLRSGYSKAIENAILDGQGQIAHDLQPGSLFLNYLNHHKTDRGHYFIMRGRRFSGTRMLVLGQAVVLAKAVLTKKIEASKAPTILRDRALQSLEKFELPEEVRRGDLVVSTESAALEGVTNVQTFKLHHGRLSRDPKPIAATLAILKASQDE
jgi:Peptidase family M48